MAPSVVMDLGKRRCRGVGRHPWRRPREGILKNPSVPIQLARACSSLRLSGLTTLRLSPGVLHFVFSSALFPGVLDLHCDAMLALRFNLFSPSLILIFHVIPRWDLVWMGFFGRGNRLVSFTLVMIYDTPSRWMLNTPSLYIVENEYNLFD
jgi:hypothetical protein